MNKIMPNEPNLGQSQIFITVVLAMDYSEKSKLDTWSKQTQTNPNLPTYMVGKFALSAVEGPINNLPAKRLRNFAFYILIFNLLYCVRS